MGRVSAHPDHTHEIPDDTCGRSARRIRAGLGVLLAALLTLAFAASALGFPNGHANPSELKPIHASGSQVAYLAKGGAAASMNTMRLCAVREGVDIYPGSSSWRPAATAYRTLAVQQILYARWRAGAGAVAAHPGTSNHGYGNADDIATPRMATWILNHGRPFGWSHDEGARVGEWWHYRYVGGFRRPNPGTSLRFPNLQRGSGGACQAQAVKEVQRRLGLRQDGEYGKATATRVRAFQRKYKLRVDGKVGSKTWLKLRKVGRDLAPKRDPRTVGTLPGQTAPMAGADVRAVQGLLNARFVELHRKRYRVKVDGLTGPTFTTAVRRFQLLTNRHYLGPAQIPVTGRVDDRTYAELLKPRAKPTPKLKVTPEGVRLVAGFEGFRSCPYLDAVGVPTVAFGHTKAVTLRSPCMSRTAGEKLLDRDLSLFATGVTRLVKVPLSLRAFNGYVSFSYNVGLGAFADSTLLRELNRKHYARAANELKRWNRAGGRELLGLTRRRRAECQMVKRGSDARTRRKLRC